jgi:hypothetical protein
VQLNGEHLIRLPVRDSKSNYLDGFWRWVAVLAADDYERALESLYWPHGEPGGFTPETLKARITTFFGGQEPWSVVIPNDRLVVQINDAADFAAPAESRPGWLLALIPLTTRPEDPTDDAIPLMGLATSFRIVELSRSYVMQLELFHI